MTSGEQERVRTSRILLVEDDPDSAEMVRLVLESAGYEVIWSATGGAAFEILSRPGRKGQTPHLDIVLLDLRLPDTDGAEMIKAVLDSGNKVPPVIVTSAFSIHKAEQAGRLIGAAAVLGKPFSIRKLLGTIAEILDPRSEI